LPDLGVNIPLEQQKKFEKIQSVQNLVPQYNIRKRNNKVNQSMTIDISRIDSSSSDYNELDHLPSIHKRAPNLFDLDNGNQVHRSQSYAMHDGHHAMSL
jgi:hypothetical protein